MERTTTIPCDLAQMFNAHRTNHIAKLGSGFRIMHEGALLLASYSLMWRLCGFCTPVPMTPRGVGLDVHFTRRYIIHPPAIQYKYKAIS